MTGVGAARDRRTAVLTAYLGAVTVAFLVALPSSGPFHPVQAMTLAALVPVPPLVVMLATGSSTNQLSSLLPITFAVVVGTTFQTIYIHTHPASWPGLLSGSDPSILPAGLVVLLVSIATLSLSYWASVRAGTARAREGPAATATRPIAPIRSHTAFLWVSAGLAIVGLVAFVYYAPRAGIDTTTLAGLLESRKRILGSGIVLGYARQGVSLASTGAVLAVAHLAHFPDVRRRAFVATATLGLGVTTVFALSTSSRSQLLLTLVTMTVVATDARRRSWSYVRLAAISVVALAILVVFGVLRAQNQSGVDYLGPLAAVESNLYASRNWIDAGPTAVIVDTVPDVVPYYGGDSIVGTLMAPVPRQLWPSKPPVSYGPVFGRDIFGFRDRITGDPPGFLNEAYLNFGPAGLLIAALGIGSALGLIDRRRLRLRHGDVRSGVTYAFVMTGTSHLLMTTSFSAAVIYVASSLLATSAACSLARTRGKALAHGDGAATTSDSELPEVTP